MPGPGGSFTPDSNDADVVVVQCSYPKCTAEPMANGPLCTVHMMDMTKRSPASKSELARQSSAQATRTKLSDHDPNGVLPIMRRKTASGGQPLNPQLQANPGGTSVSGKLTGSPTSHKAPPQRQNIHSPPDSPQRETGPARKKIRVAQNPHDHHADLQSGRPFRVTPSEATDEDKPERLRDRNGQVDTASSSTATFRYGRKIGTVGNDAKDATKRLSRPQVIRKTAPQSLVFSIEPVESTRQESSYGSEQASSTRQPKSEVSEANGIASMNRLASLESSQSAAKNFVGNKALRAWFSRYHHSSGSISQRDQRKDTAPDTPASEPMNGHLKQAGEDKVPRGFSKPTAAGSGRRQESQEPTLNPPAARKPTMRRLKEQDPEPRRKLQEPAVQHAPKTVDESSFDVLIYRQEDASAPPRGVQIPKLDAPRSFQPPDEPYYAHIDPRLHWPQQHSERWRKAKQEEIQARGGRKANFGTAKVRMREQRLREGPAEFEDQLPDRIREDPAWVRALKALRETENEASQKGKKPIRQGLRRQPSTNGAGVLRK